MTDELQLEMIAAQIEAIEFVALMHPESSPERAHCIERLAIWYDSAENIGQPYIRMIAPQNPSIC